MLDRERKRNSQREKKRGEWQSQKGKKRREVVSGVEESRRKESEH